MRKLAILITVACLLMGLTACVVSESDYQQVVLEKKALEQKLAEAEEELASLKKENKELNDSIMAIYRERDELMAKLEKIEKPGQGATTTAAAKPEPETPKEEFYMVKTGDTLIHISNVTGVSMEKLRELNNITNDDLVFAGRKLKLR